MAWRRRKVRIERRGRPPKADAKRRHRHVPPAIDRGTGELRRHKRQGTTRDDIELTVAGILFGHGHLDRMQYDRLDQIAETLRQLARNLGPRPNAIQGLWQAILGAVIHSQGTMPISVGPLADAARRRLSRMLRKLDGSRDLIIAIAENQPSPLVEHVLAGRLDAVDHAELEQLKAGLDALGKR